MNYLKQQVLASVPALFVICRYLATRPDGEDEAAVRRALQPRAMVEPEGTAPGDSERRSVLPASLAVGKDIELLEAEGTRRERVWSLRDSVRTDVASATGARLFRSLVLRLLSARAMAAVEASERPPDVALALTWLLQRDPRDPLSTSWGAGPETAVHDARLDPAVGNAEQWRALVRWARSLGLATATATTGQKARLVVDPSRAIHDVLASLPRRAPADQWFRQLRSLLPILGHPTLVSALPMPSGPVSEIPATTALAMQKLERAGRLQLAASDDASSSVVLRIGDHVRQIGDVRMREGAA